MKGHDTGLLLMIVFVVAVFAVATLYSDARCRFTPQEKEYIRQCDGKRFESFTKYSDGEVKIACRGYEINLSGAIWG